MRKIFLFTTASLMMLLLSTCSNKNESVEYLEELSSKVLSCTTMEQYDMVYEDIIAIQTDSRFKAQPGQTDKEKAEIIQAATNLTMNALAVKAVLYVVPQDVTLMPRDMQNLAKQCVEKKLNIHIAPYAEVKALVKSHFNLPNE